MPTLKVYDGVSWQYLTGAGGGSLLVAETTVSGSAVTSVTFSGLDGNAAGGYTFTYEGVSETSNSMIYITFNGDDTNSNYYARYISFYSSSVVTTLGAGNNFIGYISGVSGASPVCFSHGAIGLTRSHIAVTADILYNSTTDPAGFRTNIIHNAVSSNITSVKITAATADGIGVGSTFRLYKRK